MEDLTALELLIIAAIAAAAMDAPDAGNLKIIYAEIARKLSKELHSREHRELMAALMDLKKIEPRVGFKNQR